MPQAYRIVRKVQRRIGDNALCIRKWPAMEGRIYAVAFAPDGKSFAAGSSLDGKGAVNFYNYDFNTEMPAEILAIEDKAGRTEEEKKQGGSALHERREAARAACRSMRGVYALAYQPDGKAVAAAGEDGKVRFIDARRRQGAQGIVPVPHRRQPAPLQTVKLDSK